MLFQQKFRFRIGSSSTGTLFLTVCRMVLITANWNLGHKYCTMLSVATILPVYTTSLQGPFHFTEENLLNQAHLVSTQQSGVRTTPTISILSSQNICHQMQCNAMQCNVNVRIKHLEQCFPQSRY